MLQRAKASETNTASVYLQVYHSLQRAEMQCDVRVIRNDTFPLGNSLRVCDQRYAVL